MPTRSRTGFIAVIVLSLGLGLGPCFVAPSFAESESDQDYGSPAQTIRPVGPLEVPSDPFVAVPISERVTSPGRRLLRNGHVSIQVNVDSGGANIVGDAANEPSLAVDPTDPQRIAVGWRQFDTITSNFRQAGWAFSSDGGDTWTFAGVIEPGIFRSDPVLGSDSSGNFYYDSLGGNMQCEVFKSANSGVSWGSGVPAYGGDKQWMAIDRSGGIGNGHIYQHWTDFAGWGSFNRSVDGGLSFESPFTPPESPVWGVNTVGPDGALYIVGSTYSGHSVIRSLNAQDSGVTPVFDLTTTINLGGEQLGMEISSPNPAGLLGQVWIAADHSGGATHGNLYVLCSVDPPGSDPLDVNLIRSEDSGATWSAPVTVNDDVGNAWQWFGTMAVAPDGRIDVIWNDTRADPGGFDSELYYAYSTDAGLTFSPNQVLSDPFDPHVGWPQQNKLGDYYDIVSDHTGVHIAWAATHNGEQDVYYLHLDPPGQDLFSDGFESGDTSVWSTSSP